MLSTVAFEHFAVPGIDADFGLLARMHIGQLGFLEIGFDIGAVGRNKRHQALAGLHELAGFHRAIGDDAVEGRADLVKERSRSALASAVCNSASDFSAWTLFAAITSSCACAARISACASLTEAFDASCFSGRVIHCLLAHNLCLDERAARLRLANVLLSAASALASLASAAAIWAFCASVWLAKPCDHRFLRFDVGLGGINRQPVVAVVKLENDIAGLDRGIFRRRNFRDIARNLGAELRHVGFHIGIIGGNLEAAQHIPVVAIIGGPRKGSQNDGPENGAPHDGRALGLCFNRRCSGLGRLRRGGKGELWQRGAGLLQGGGRRRIGRNLTS